MAVEFALIAKRSAANYNLEFVAHKIFIGSQTEEINRVIGAVVVAESRFEL